MAPRFTWIIGVLVLGLNGASPRIVAQKAGRSAPAALPRIDELNAGWNRLRPGGGTTCAKGKEYYFFVRSGARDKLLVYLQGGGGCTRAENCANDQRYHPDLESQPEPTV